jgi:NTE family protein
MEFELYDSIMAFGEQVAREHYAALKSLADSLNAIEYKPVKTYTTVPVSSIMVDSLIVRGNKKMPDKYFESIFGVYRKKQVSIDDLEKDIRLTYGSGYFDRVSYDLDYEHGMTNLVINAEEAGPGEVSAGVHYDTDYGICFTLGGAFRNVLGRNSKLFADINLALNPRIRATYLLGMGGKGAFGARAEFYTLKVNTYDKNVKTNMFNLTNYDGSLFFNLNSRNMVNLRAGFKYEYFRFRQDITIDSLFLQYENFSSYGSVFVSFNADTRNRPTFPTRGVKTEFKTEYVMPFSKNISQQLFSNSVIISLKFDQNIPLYRKLILRPGLFAGATLNKNGNPPIQHMFGLGGLAPDNYIESFVPFTGLDFIQDFGYYALVGRLNLQYNVYKKIYAGVRADAGGNEATLDELFMGSNFLVGYGVTAGYDSFIGPLEVSVMSSNINPGVMFFVNLGYWF